MRIFCCLVYIQKYIERSQTIINLRLGVSSAKGSANGICRHLVNFAKGLDPDQVLHFVVHELDLVS